MKTEQQTVAPTQKQEQIRIVINGGSNTLNSATVPYSWFFSDELITKQPTHLLVIDQSEWVAKHSSSAEYQGERRVVRVDRSSDFIQFHSPGYHRIAVIALKKPTSWSEKHYAILPKKMTRERKHGQYEEPLYWNDILSLQHGGQAADQGLDSCAVGATVLEVDIPEEFFAAEPQGQVGKFLHWAANFGLAGKSVDECQFRQRLLWAAPKFLGYALWLAFVNAVCIPLACIACSLWLVGARLAVLLAGFRPEPIFLGFRDLWSWKRKFDDVDWDIRKYGKGSHAIWKKSWDSKTGKTVYMWTTGTEVALFLLLAFSLSGIKLGVVEIIKQFGWGTLVSTAILLVFSCFLILALTVLTENRLHLKEGVTRWFEKKSSEGTTAKTREEPPKEPALLFFEWLRAEHHIGKSPAHVGFGNLPPAFRKRSVQRFRAAFWWTKSKVCRPYRY